MDTQFESKPALPWNLKRATKTIILLHENDFIFLVSIRENNNNNNNNLRMIFVIYNMASKLAQFWTKEFAYVIIVVHNLMAQTKIW